MDKFAAFLGAVLLLIVSTVLYTTFSIKPTTIEKANEICLPNGGVVKYTIYVDMVRVHCNNKLTTTLNKE